MTFYNHDEMDVPHEDSHDKVIAELFFRLDVTIKEHERDVVQIDGFLDSIAGIFDLLMIILTFFFGGYISFKTRLGWIQQLYNTQQNQTQSSEKSN